MINILKYSLLFLFLLLLQKYVLDQVPQIVPYSKLCIGFLFIIALPVIPGVWMMFIAFCTGLVFDFFYNTPGINSACFVLIAYIRDRLLFLFNDDEENVEFGVHINFLGFGRYFGYVLIIAFLFHLLSEFLLVFTFQDAGQTILRIITNTIGSAILIYILEILFFYRRSALK